MRVSNKYILACSATLLALGLAGNSLAQELPPNPLAPGITVNPCRGDLTVSTPQQTGIDVEFVINVTITDCEGSCTGTLEYTLLLLDANGINLEWHMTESWDWRQVTEPFTVQVQHQLPAGAQLQEVQSAQIGRCSCAT